MGLGLGMARGKDGTAVLIGENGRVERADLAGDADNLLLVHADERAQDGQLHHVLAHAQGLHCLAGDLPEAFAGDERLGAHLVCHALGKAHHEAAHDEREMVLGAVHTNLFLNFGERHDVDGQPPAPRREQLRELEHLFLGGVGGVGRGEEMDHFKRYAALCHHVGRDGRVDAAGEQRHGAAAHADGQSARTRLGGSVDVGRVVADLDKHRQLGVVDVDRATRERLMQRAADLLGELNGGEREGFVRALALNLEILRAGKFWGKVILSGADDSLHVLFTGQGAADGDDAEDLLAGGVGGGEVALVVHRLNINGTLLGVDAEIAALRRAAAQISDQLILKAAAVEALEDHLAELAQDHFTHGGSSPYRPCAPLPRRERRYYF